MIIYGYIYEIKNLINNKVYIGQTIDKNIREYQHFYGLRKKAHDNPYLQSSYNKYGEENFSFRIIDSSAINKEELTELEEYYMLQAGFPDRNKCYNLQLPNCIPAESYEIYQEKQEDICNDYINDMTVNQICEKYHIRLGLLYKILKNNNICVGQKGKRLDLYEQINDIIKYFTVDKMTASAIAKIYDTSPTMILKLLRKNNIKVEQYKNYRHPIWDKAKNICEFYLEVKSLTKTSKKYGVSADTIRHILLENGIDIQNNKREDIDEQDVCNLYKKGLSSRKIAQKYNCTKGTILNIIRKNNIQPHPNTTTFKKGNIPHNKGKSIIEERGGVVYLYNNRDTDIKQNTIKTYLNKKGVGVKEFFNLSFAQTSLVDYPDEVCLCLNTKSCKNNCVYCFNKQLKKGKPLSFDVAKFAIDYNMEYISAISVTGGEPLLNNDLCQIIDYAYDNNLKTKIDTSLKGNINNISKNIDLINISIKNYQHLIDIKDDIEYLLDNNYNCELNLVYHPDYLQDKELSQINNIISRFNIPLRVVEMDVSYCNFNQSPSRQELLKATSFFSKNDVYIETKANGIEKVI